MRGQPLSKTSNASAGTGAYFLGFLGSVVYFISSAEGFGDGFLGFLKSLVWPAFLVYEALSFFGA